MKNVPLVQMDITMLLLLLLVWHVLLTVNASQPHQTFVTVVCLQITFMMEHQLQKHVKLAPLLTAKLVLQTLLNAPHVNRVSLENQKQNVLLALLIVKHVIRPTIVLLVKMDISHLHYQLV
jgi:hypothetical protein